jgi:hypothetical protein
MDMPADIVAEGAVLVIVIAMVIVEGMLMEVMTLIVEACWVAAGIYRRESYELIEFLARERLL